MNANVNTHSERVFKPTQKSWFEHRCIPNLAIGTNQPFTIMLRFFSTEDTQALLYGQEGGFSIQLVNHYLIFSLAGFCIFESSEKLKLTPQRAYNITFRYNKDKIEVFLDDKPVYEKGVTPTATTCTGNYFLGKHFTGGIASVRIYSNALSNDEFIRLLEFFPAPGENCVFHSDCTTPQYKDIGKYKLPLWITGREACCGIITACSVFNSKGNYRCNVPAAAPVESSLLIKCWPNPCTQRQTLYTALFGETIAYSLELIPQPNATFQLCLVGADCEVLFSKTLMPQLWQDIALVFSKERVIFYLDGIFQTETAFKFKPNRNIILIGAEKRYNGYVADTAEFSYALTPDKIAACCNTRLHSSEPGLLSYLKLDCTDNIEVISKTPITTEGEPGGAMFRFVASTTPFDTPMEISLESRHFIWTNDPLQNRSGITEGALGTEVIHQNISPRLFRQWMEKLDEIYDAYSELVGGTPANGEKIRLVPTDPSIIDAYAYVVPGRYLPYIFWNSNHIPASLSSIQNTNGGDTCFGILHEMGHLFDLEDKWTFHSEFFANIKIYYALESKGLKTYHPRLGSLEGGKESMEKLYKEELAVFSKNPKEYPLFDGGAAENLLILFYPVLQALGGWDAGWEIMKKVFRSYFPPNPEPTELFAGKNVLARQFFLKIREIAQKDITTQFPKGLKELMSPSTYFRLDGLEPEKDLPLPIPHIQYVAPYGNVSGDSNQIILQFKQKATPVITPEEKDRKAVIVHLFSKEYRLTDAGCVPVYVGAKGGYTYSCTLSETDIPTLVTENTTGEQYYKLTLPFSRFGNLNDVIINGMQPFENTLAACRVTVDQGAFCYENGEPTHSKDWEDVFFRTMLKAPRIHTLSPAFGAAKVPENGTLFITFEWQMDKSVGVVSLNNGIGLLKGVWSADGLTYMAFYKGLLKNKIYTAQLSDFTDMDGNQVPVINHQFTRDSVFPNIENTLDLNCSPNKSGDNWVYEGKTVTVKSNANLILSGNVTDRYCITVEPGAKNVQITLSNLKIESNTQNIHPIQVADAEVTLILAEGSNNELIANEENTAGIHADHAILTISGTGKLTVKGGGWRPAIGGIRSNITINDGTITAIGGTFAAGIGGKPRRIETPGSEDDGNGGIITINGGNVTAIGSGWGSGYPHGGAGIGGGAGGSGGTITITGGTIIADTLSENNHAAAIGGGGDYSEFTGAGGAITITGGHIVTKSNKGACIGGGFKASSGAIRIEGGDITAINHNSAGIGTGSYEGGACDIILRGGTVYAYSFENPAIGSWGDGEIRITGGNISNGSIILPQPIQKINTKLYKNTLTFPENVPVGSPVTGGKINHVDCNPAKPSGEPGNEPYGIYNVEVGENRTICIWLPATPLAEPVEFVVNGITYSANYQRPEQDIEQTLKK